MREIERRTRETKSGDRAGEDREERQDERDWERMIERGGRDLDTDRAKRESKGE